ncbi:dienelactone hydrolase family protein [Methyloterricola oryzae]|uniref:dienelactone hydrolase family protein n=1 Tax=Methyloterricola oryzae TaxID=1495050 RepID=UPI0005EBEB14|nr:dienelactone hydrolase family protein [Methyloterricola oryzae]
MSADIQTRSVEYAHGSTRLLGFLAWDDSLPKPLPAVLVSHAWGGRDEFACGKAQALARLGYAGFALDMYGDARVGSGPEENSRLMAPFMKDRALLQARQLAALQAVRALSEVDGTRVAAIGFCFGGLCVLDLARTGADIRGVVSFHGLLNPPENIAGRPILAKVLALHGHDDPMAPPEQVLALQRELTTAGADWQVQVYGHTLHAFTNPRANDPGFGTVYKEIADRRSWQSMQNFLSEVLK